MCIDLIYPILLTYNNKLIHSATEMTPKEATKPENELNAYVNMKLKAKHSRRYTPIAVGDKVHIYITNENRLTNPMSQYGQMHLTPSKAHRMHTD